MEDFVVEWEGVELQGGEAGVGSGGYEEEESSCGDAG